MEGLTQSFLQFIEDWGYMAVIILMAAENACIPIPSELILGFAGYLVFEMVPINYRPVLIEGILEASYPSSTTLLVLSVMPATIMQIGRRVKTPATAKVLQIICVAFALFMVLGRLISGVHWLTDIMGGILLSGGLVALLAACTETAANK